MRIAGLDPGKQREKRRQWKRDYYYRHKERLNKQKLEQYYENRKNPTWVKNFNQKRREYYQKSKKRVSERNRRYRIELKLEAILHYSNLDCCCACCGESLIEFLSIDHINNDGASHRKTMKTQSEFYRWLRKNEYPEGFQVLCMNCNFAKGHFGVCPHQGGEKTI